MGAANSIWLILLSQEAENQNLQLVETVTKLYS
jgi:hypothetical protein